MAMVFVDTAAYGQAGSPFHLCRARAGAAAVPFDNLIALADSPDSVVAAVTAARGRAPPSRITGRGGRSPRPGPRFALRHRPPHWRPSRQGAAGTRADPGGDSGIPGCDRDRRDASYLATAHETEGDQWNLRTRTPQYTSQHSAPRTSANPSPMAPQARRLGHVRCVVGRPGTHQTRLRSCLQPRAPAPLTSCSLLGWPRLPGWSGPAPAAGTTAALPSTRCPWKAPTATRRSCAISGPGGRDSPRTSVST
jgi:hypothetical protein